MKDRTFGVILSIASAFLIGSNFVIIRQLLSVTTVPNLLFHWFGLASILLFAVIMARKEIKFTSTVRNELRPALTLAAFGVLTAALYFTSLSFLSSSFFAFVMKFATVITVLMGIVMLKERFSLVEGAGAVIAILGTFLLAYAPADFAAIGITIGFTAALVIGLQDFVWKLIVKRTHPVTMNFYRTLAIALALAVFLAFRGGFSPFPSSHIHLLVLGVVLSPVLGVGSLMLAMSKLEASRVVAIRTVEPFIVAAIAFLFLGEIPGINEFFGGSLIVAGILLLTLFHPVSSRFRKKALNKQRSSSLA